MLCGWAIAGFLVWNLLAYTFAYTFMCCVTRMADRIDQTDFLVLKNGKLVKDRNGYEYTKQ